MTMCRLQRHVFAQPAAAIAQLGERQTEDLKVPGSIPGLGSLPISYPRVLHLKSMLRFILHFAGNEAVT